MGIFHFTSCRYGNQDSGAAFPKFQTVRYIVLGTAIWSLATTASDHKRKCNGRLTTISGQRTVTPRNALIRKILARGAIPLSLRRKKNISASRKLAADRYSAEGGLVSTNPRFGDDGPWEEQTTEYSMEDSATARPYYTSHQSKRIGTPENPGLQERAVGTESSKESLSEDDDSSTSFESETESSAPSSSAPRKRSKPGGPSRRAQRTEPRIDPPSEKEGEEEWERAVRENLHAFDRKRGRWTIK